MNIPRKSHYPLDLCLIFLVLLQACHSSNKISTIPDIMAQQVVSGFANPTQVTHAGNGDGLLYVVEQRGTIRTVSNGQISPTSFLDISAGGVVNSGEMGLLGVAFHPQFQNNGRFFVNYVSNLNCDAEANCTKIDEFTVGATAILENSRREVLSIDQPRGNHNGGQIAFGPDGYLYIGMGDGGDSSANGQDLSTLHGAMLRIDVDSTAVGYAIPADNPSWTGVAGARREIWAYGLRNPWRFSFDPLNGDLYLGDVGAGAVEEIDIVTKGQNYGWNIVEGDQCLGVCNLGDYTPPIATHDHGDGWIAITGGVVYRGSAYPALYGVYIYGDHSALPLQGLRYNNGSVVSGPRALGASISHVSSFGYDANHEVYAVGHDNGTLYRIGLP